MESGWDKKMASTLVSMGVPWTSVMLVVGMIAEERQNADRDGYCRGYNNGYADCQNKEPKHED